MSVQAKQDAVEGLLREGSANYLDALYALHRFKRTVTDTAVAVWNPLVPHPTVTPTVWGMSATAIGPGLPVGCGFQSRGTDFAIWD